MWIDTKIETFWPSLFYECKNFVPQSLPHGCSVSFQEESWHPSLTYVPSPSLAHVQH